jgi:hypothetical protein
MATVVVETREVYQCEVSKDYELRWFLCHAKRWLEKAHDEGKECEILIGNCPYRPRNFEELRRMWQEVIQKTAPYFKEGKSIFCRIIFQTP